MELQDKDKLIHESITIRGICASIQAMTFPTLKNVIDLFEKAGINLKIIEKK